MLCIYQIVGFQVFNSFGANQSFELDKCIQEHTSRMKCIVRPVCGRMSFIITLRATMIHRNLENLIVI